MLTDHSLHSPTRSAIGLRDERQSPQLGSGDTRPVRLRRARAAVAAGVAVVVLVGTAGACTSDTNRTSSPTVDGPSMTTVPEGGGTVTAERLEPPKQSGDELSRIVVRNADGIFWDGSKETRSVTRKGQRYRLVGQCLPTTAGGTLVVEVLGQGPGGAVDGEPSQPVPGPPVAAITVPCDGNAATLDLDRLPASSGELMVAEATSQVSVGWVVLTRVT